MDTLRQDLRLALRMLTRNPGFMAVAILCIAFGIGTNVTAFSVVSAVLLRPFPYADPDRIVQLVMVNPRKDVEDGGLSFPDWMDFRSQVRSLSEVEAYGIRTLVVSGGDELPWRPSRASCPRGGRRGWIPWRRCGRSRGAPSPGPSPA